MPSDPFVDPLFAPTAIRIVALMGVAGLALLLIQRGRGLRESPLFRKLFSWAIMAPTFTIGVLSGGVISFALVVFMSVQSLREFGRIVALRKSYSVALIAYAVVALAVTAHFGARFFLFMPLGLFGVATIIPLVRLSRPGREPRAELMQSSAMVLGYLWVALFLSFFVLIGRTEPAGRSILLLFGFAIALSDIAAFTLGSILRGSRLSPLVSPNKTWSGVVGNLAGPYLAFWLMAFAVPGDWSLATRWILPAVLGIGAVWGDLVESLVKRAFATKDAGDILPGFGGLLDRIDSLLVAMPLGYYAMKILIFAT